MEEKKRSDARKEAENRKIAKDVIREIDRIQAINKKYSMT